jgi:capsular exopolysaccharide synthesis family protein
MLQASKDESVFDVAGVLLLLSRRRKWIFGSALFFTALAGLLCVVMTPRYKAIATIELLKQEVGTLAEAGQSDSSGSTQADDALNFSLSLQTQVALLQSDALALQVIKELNLAETDDFQYKPLIKTKEVRSNMALPIDQSAIKRTYVLKRWSKHLKVDPVAGTRVIKISFSHPDPNMSAQIVNRLLADFVEYRYQVRYNAMERSAESLRSKLAGIRAQVKDSQTHLVQVQKDTGVYGPDQDHNIIIARLEQLNTAAADAHSNRAAEEAIYNLARSGNPELVAGLVAGSNQTGNSQGNNAPTLLIGLRQQEADLNGQYAEAASRYGPDNPRLIQLKNKLEVARYEIKSETARIVGRARQDYLAAVAAEVAANGALEDQKRLASEMDEKTIDLEIAKHEADSARDVYQHLLKQVSESPILAGVRSTEVNIVDTAVPPGLPSSPIVPLYLGLAFLLGTTMGVGAAFVRDSIDSTLRNPEDIEAITQLPVLGVIPRSRSMARSLWSKLQPKDDQRSFAGNLLFGRNGSAYLPLGGALSSSNSQVMEAFRSVRTAVLLSRPDNPRRVLMISSALPGEGKSFSSLHLASVLAQNGASVLLVDADLRRSTLTQNLKMPLSVGLSTLLSNESSTLLSNESCQGAYQQVEEVSGLTFLGAGLVASNPAELLGSKKMAQLIAGWREEYDFVVIDSPAILGVTDAAILSAVVDGVMVVVRFAVSTRQSILRAIRLLVDVGAQCFGVLVNGMDLQSADYASYSGEYGLAGYHGSPIASTAASSRSQALQEERL